MSSPPFLSSSSLLTPPLPLALPPPSPTSHAAQEKPREEGNAKGRKEKRRKENEMKKVEFTEHCNISLSRFPLFISSCLVLYLLLLSFLQTCPCLIRSISASPPPTRTGAAGQHTHTHGTQQARAGQAASGVVSGMMWLKGPQRP